MSLFYYQQKPLNIDEEDEDEEEEDTLLSWNERTQFLSDQEIKDALETIPNKVWDLVMNFGFYPLKTHLFITVLIYQDGDFIHKKAINYLYQVKNYV
jgi:hypothetical protein